MGKQQAPPPAENWESGERFIDPLQNNNNKNNIKKKEKPFLRSTGILLTASQVNIRVDGFRHQQSPGEIRQDFWLMRFCSTTSQEAAWEACLLHKPGPAAAATQGRQPLAVLSATGKKLPSMVSSGSRDGTWTSRVPPKLPSTRTLQRDGGYPANCWLEQSVPGRNPRAYLKRAPFHPLAIRLLLALLTGAFSVQEKFTGVGGRRGKSVRLGWREGAFQTLTSPKIVFYATKNQVSLVHTTKCLTFFKSMTK